MNLHMPQDPESESELLNLAAVPYQIISPSNNAPIIGIYQDSMVGSFQFTRDTVNFSIREAMNLLMMCKRINVEKLLSHGDRVTSFNVLSQIMPSFSIKMKNKLFGEKDDLSKSNNVVEVKNGEYLRGQIDKGIFAGGGLIQHCCNDFGNMAASTFIDDLQNIVTEYMKGTAFSVGISDLIISDTANNNIVKIINEKKNAVKSIIDQVQIGAFENNSGKTNEQEFESQIDNVLKKITAETGKECLNNLQKDNRFVAMSQSGSKGSDLNITFMIACLGQQNVDGKRIPYGFEHRTLPHYTKYDDTPVARGFVESSYIHGLTPQELFFHAMGGRIGLIDTAVKTSSTGYIQRRLIKGLEDLMVSYDMTIRTSKNKIVQFSYGDDNIDTIKVENQELRLVTMSIQDIYAHFNNPQEDFTMKQMSLLFVKAAITRFKKELPAFIEKCKYYTEFMINKRNEIVKYVFGNKDEKIVRAPVGFAHLINNAIGQHNLSATSLVDITPLEAYDLIEHYYAQLEKLYYVAPTQLFKTLYYFYLSPKDLLFSKRFNRVALTALLETISLNYKRAIVAPGEMVGMIAAQSIGEPTTQMSLAYDEHVKLVKVDKRTGAPTIVSAHIGDFCDDLIEKYPERTFGTGHVNSVETLLEGLDEEYYVIGVDKEEKTVWNKLSHVSRHPVNGNMMKVTTKSGRVVHTTTSHSHLVRANQTVEAIVGANMKPGMRIPVAKHIDNLFVNSHVQIGELPPYKLDYSFGAFIGAYLANGSYTPSKIFISNVPSSCMSKLDNVILGYDETGSGDDELSNISVRSKDLASFIERTCKTVVFDKVVPDFAFTAPNDFKATLIQTYADMSGAILCDEDKKQIEIYCRSKQLVSDLALLLCYFDIFATITNKPTVEPGVQSFTLIIPACYSAQYFRCIGSATHTAELYEFSKHYALPFDCDQINGLGPVLKSCYKEIPVYSVAALSNEETVSRLTLKQIIRDIEYHPNSDKVEKELAILRQAYYSGVIWDEVVSIETYSAPQTEVVYDFTVPANQTFMTSYGIIVHNTLNTFHFAGVASKSNVTRGVPRIEEILSLSTEPKNPLLTVYLKPDDETDRTKAQTIMYMLEHTKMREVVQTVELCFDPDDLNTMIEADRTTMEQYKRVEDILKECAEDNSSEEAVKSKWVIRMEMDAEVMLEKNITMDDIHFTLNNSFGEEISCVYADYNADKLVFRIRMNEVISNSRSSIKKTKGNSLDQSDQIYLLKNFQEQMLDNVVLRGIKGIDSVVLRKIKDNVVETAGAFKQQEIWVLDGVGSNLLDVLALDYIDSTRTYSNHIVETYNVLGIEAARQSIYNELVEVLEFDSAYINYHHLSLLCDRMTYTHRLISIFRHGINSDNIGPIAKASFEETPKIFLDAAQHAELDIMRGISANVMCGQEGFYGTSAFQVILDIEEMKKQQPVDVSFADETKELENLLSGLKDAEAGNVCSTDNLKINNYVANIKQTKLGEDNEYNPGF